MGRRTPLDEEPEINDFEVLWLIRTYVELSKQRNVSEYVDPIPISEMLLYITTIYGELLIDYRIELLTNLDVRFVKLKNEEINRKKKNGNTRSRN